ncbi:MAG: DUF1614 domain-containing protein [Syntrophobacterales bacterium]|jgi:uncharacterized membrane protein|nr:DUF1614 domain-containing protein [Syntrophobacterales bacterium]
MIFPPLIFLLMLAFFLVALVMLPFLLLGLIGQAFILLGLSPSLMFWLLILTLVGSLVNIPIYKFRNREVVGEQVVSYFGMRFRVPRMEQAHETILAINVGGALIPIGLSVYLMSRINFGVSLPILVAVVTLVVNRLARPVRGLGIAVPGLAPPLVAALGAYLFCPPELRAPCAYIASTMGILIGADLLNLWQIRELGAPVASIGGAGTFDAIFLSGIIAVLLS